MKGTVATLAVLLVAAAGWAGYRTFARPVTHVRWVVAHQPVGLFDRAQHVFADTFNANSDGMRIDILGEGPADFGAGRSGLDRQRVFGLLDSGDVQLASLSIAYLRQIDPRLGVLALPYEFASYDTVQPVIEGPAGQQLLDGISATSSIRALGFTFSGGYEMIVTNGFAVRAPADLRGKRVGTPNGPIAEDILRAMGATPVHLDASLNNDDIERELRDGAIDGVEYPYSRLYFATTTPQKFTVSETQHSLFLTALIVSDSFYDGLSEKNKAAFRQAALAATRAEREDSVALAQATRAGLEGNGDRIITLTPAQRSVFTARTASVTSKYTPVFGADRIQQILTAQQSD